MPRVHKMRTDLAQYYYSNTPSVRLQYISTNAEKVNFVINGTQLLMRDFNIFATTRTNHRQVLDQLKQMALTNNTTGASIYDLGNILKADSIAEVTDILRDSELKTEQMRQQEMQQQREMQQQQLEATAKENQLKLEFQANESQLERQKDITVAEIRAAGYGSMMDVNENKESDYKEAIEDIRQTSQYREQMNMKREQNAMKNAQAQAKLQIDREKLATQREIANKNLQIAKENKNKYDDKN